MSTAHDELYMSEDLSRIELGGYLADLARRVIGDRARDSAKPTFVLETNEVSVGLEAAIDCGLIVNELVNNALRHAFPSMTDSEIRIRLSKDHEGRVTIEVADNGIGLKPGFDIKKDGRLGLKIISRLANGKLRADFEIRSERGLRCQLSFKE